MSSKDSPKSSSSAASQRRLLDNDSELGDDADGGNFEIDHSPESLSHASFADARSRSNSALAQTSGPYLDRPGSEAESKNDPFTHRTRPQWVTPPNEDSEEEEEEEEEDPAFLLVEGHPGNQIPLQQLPPEPSISTIPNSDGEHIIDMDEHTSHISSPEPPPRSRLIPPSLFRIPSGTHHDIVTPDRKNLAFQRWSNIINLDNFLNDVYTYYLGNGFWSIWLHRLLTTLTIGFVVFFSTFLVQCIDYSAIPHSRSLRQVVIPKCGKKMPWWFDVALWLFSTFWVFKVFQYLFSLGKLRELHDFYHHLLGIADYDIQTISWPEIVERLLPLRDLNPTTRVSQTNTHEVVSKKSRQRMEAPDVANRIMRKENYFIALFNNTDILNLKMNLPFVGEYELLSRTLQLNLEWCIVTHVVDRQGKVHPEILDASKREQHIRSLQKNFKLMGAINLLFAPFILFYCFLHHFFRHFLEFQRNPSRISIRQYTPLAEWKFRKFNELEHIFQRRLNMSYPYANRYLDQFPKDKTVQVARFVAFVSGSIASVLGLASIVDPDLFTGFEITPDRSVFFYLGFFGSVWAFARGMVPEQETFDPEWALKEVVSFTHYQPDHWKGQMHSDKVRGEFAAFFRQKVLIFIDELLGMILTPVTLFFRLPGRCDRIIDFFREQTIYVDGLGHVCSYAEFSPQKITNENIGNDRRAPGGANANDEKMVSSYLWFVNQYGNQQHPFNAAARRPNVLPTVNSGVQSTYLDPYAMQEERGHVRNPIPKHDRMMMMRNTERLPTAQTERGPRFNGHNINGISPSAMKFGAPPFPAHSPHATDQHDRIPSVRSSPQNSIMTSNGKQDHETTAIDMLAMAAGGEDDDGQDFRDSWEMNLKGDDDDDHDGGGGDDDDDDDEDDLDEDDEYGRDARRSGILGLASNFRRVHHNMATRAGHRGALGL